MIGVMANWFTSNLPEDGSVELQDLSPETSIIALQGPDSKSIISKVLSAENHVGRFRWQQISDNSLGVTGWIQGTG